MKKINYGLIVSDFDGTLIDGKHRVLPEVREKISDYIACGGIFAVCTGRMLRSILPQVRSLGLKGLVVAYQGTVIADIESGEFLKRGGISTQDCVRICKTLEGLECTFNVYADENLYTNIPKDNEYLKLYEKITGVEGIYVDKLSEFVKEKGLFCQKVACLVMPKKREQLYNTLARLLASEFDVTCSADCLVEVSPFSDDKGGALKFLAEHYKIPLGKTVAVGDNLNDLSMIKAAGMGVAVGNAVPELKLAADFVSVSNDEGAVAKIIDKYGFA